MLQVKRTLVKSVPELWAEISDATAVARHLEPFGSVRITRSDPERLVEWEGDRGRGTVRLEPSGFGTRVILTAATGLRTPDLEPATGTGRSAADADGRFPRWRRFRRREAERPAAVTPDPPASRPGLPPIAEDVALMVLTETLDALGRAHNRPFTRL